MIVIGIMKNNVHRLLCSESEKESLFFNSEDIVSLIMKVMRIAEMGVSASHLDWTMVPYVRKSFAKHYKDGFIWVEGCPWSEVDYEIEHMINDSTQYSITDPEWKAYSYKSYDYAIAMTVKEIHQAVEGLYHNLNTL